MKGAKGDPHKIIITLSNLFTTPLATGVPFNWQDLTPVSMMALDQFVLWVNAESPYKTRQGLHRGGEGGRPQQDQDGRHRLQAGRPDHHRRRWRRPTGTKFIYMPFKGGGEVAVQLVGKHIDSTVNNPIEAVAQWRAGKLRAAVRVRRHSACPTRTKVTDTQSWDDIPTCKEAGVPTDYVMLRGIFMAAGVTRRADGTTTSTC